MTRINLTLSASQMCDYMFDITDKYEGIQIWQERICEMGNERKINRTKSIYYNYTGL